MQHAIINFRVIWVILAAAMVNWSWFNTCGPQFDVFCRLAHFDAGWRPAKRYPEEWNPQQVAVGCLFAKNGLTCQSSQPWLTMFRMMLIILPQNANLKPIKIS